MTTPLSLDIRKRLDQVDKQVRLNTIYLACLPKSGLSYGSSALPAGWEEYNKDSRLSNAWVSLNPDERSFIFREFESRAMNASTSVHKQRLLESLIVKYTPEEVVSRPTVENKLPPLSIPPEKVSPSEQPAVEESVSQPPPVVKRTSTTSPSVSDNQLDTRIKRRVLEVLNISVVGKEKAPQRLYLHIKYSSVDSRRESDQGKEWVDAKRLLTDDVIETLIKKQKSL